jgi:thiamine biosynthesis lipoprotein
VRSSDSGGKKKVSPWRIGIQNPLHERGAYIGVLSLANTSVVTSGVYERFFESGGKRYHHILSTTDGYPVNNGLLSVTIIAESSTGADALSTAVFALGYEKGRALLDSLNGIEGIFIFDNLSVTITEGLHGRFELSESSFVLND